MQYYKSSLSLFPSELSFRVGDEISIVGFKDNYRKWKPVSQNQYLAFSVNLFFLQIGGRSSMTVLITVWRAARSVCLCDCSTV